MSKIVRPVVLPGMEDRDLSTVGPARTDPGEADEPNELPKDDEELKERNPGANVRTNSELRRSAQHLLTSEFV